MIHRLAVSIEGPVDRVQLRDALTRCVQAHPLFVTVYHRDLGVASTPLAIRASSAERVVEEFPFPNDARLERYFEGELDGAIDLERGPLVAFSLGGTSDFGSVLLLSMPAMYADALTQQNLVTEMARLCGANVGAAPSSPRQFSYSDYCALGEALRKADAARPGVEFWARWSERLAPRVHSPQGAAGSARRGWQSAPQAIGAPLVEGLTKGNGGRCRSIESALLVCWMALVDRLAGCASAGVAVYSDGRTDAELRGALGAFARYLPVGMDLRRDLALVELARTADDELQQARAWQECFPFDFGGAARFQFGFTFVDLPEVTVTNGVTLRTIRRELDVEPFDVELVVQRSGGGLEISVRAAPGFLAAIETDAWAQAYVRMIEAVVERPSVRMGDPELAGRDGAVPSPPSVFGSDEPFCRSFGRCAAEHPDRLAVVSSEGQISYRELDSRSNRLARLLSVKGVQPEQRIGLYAERSLAAMIAVLGIAKAGAACVPLEPRDPSARVARLIRSANLALVLSQDHLASELPSNLAEIASLESGWAVIGDQPDQGLAADPLPGMLAYVLHTSGTTGVPAPCMVEHRSVANLARALRTTVYRATEGPLRVGVNGSLAFDTSVKQWLQLGAGHTLILFPDEVRDDPRTLTAFIEDRSVEVLDCTPAHLDLLSRVEFVDRPPGSVRSVLVGGDDIPGRMWNALARSESPEYFNLYGPTECTVDSTIAKVRDHAPAPSLGRAICGARVYVVDHSQKLAPVGCRGELLIGGAGLARGYDRQPDATAARFVPDPFSGEPGARLYRTSDIARQRGDGSFEFLFRRQGHLKVRGYRVDPREIQRTLEDHPGVESAWVVPADEGGEPSVSAFVTPVRSMAHTVAGRERHRLPNRLAVAHLNKNETEFLYREIFERQAYFRHGISIRPGDVVFDVGANIGLFTLRAHLAAADVRIYAFEPNPAAFRALRDNVMLYGVNADIFALALSDRAGQAELGVYPAFSILSGFDADPTEEKKTVLAHLRNESKAGVVSGAGQDRSFDELLDTKLQRTWVPASTQTLSAVADERGVDRIDLLKINVEKGEERLFEGITEETWRKIQNVAMEVHDLDGRLARIRNKLESQGFSVAVEKDWSLGAQADTNYYVYARKNPIANEPPTAAPPNPNLPEPFLLAADLQAFLAERLPAHALPSRLTVIDRVPLTHNGKPDMQALADLARANGHARSRPPESGLEKAIAATWQAVLQIPDVPTDRSFFDLGGDSFRLVQVKEALKRAIDRDVRVMDLFRHPTIESLARFLAKPSLEGSDVVSSQSSERARKQMAAMAAMRAERDKREPPDSEE
jgi:amino acid adenylation domain-containing protein/FkbM family methyltransferase